MFKAFSLLGFALVLTACNTGTPTNIQTNTEPAPVEVAEEIPEIVIEEVEEVLAPEPVVETEPEPEVITEDIVIIEEEPPLPPAVIEAYEAEQVEAEVAQAEIEAVVAAEPETVSEIGSGSFVGLDAGHDASGQVKILEMGDDIILEFQGSFTTTPGPDLYVYISQPQSFGPQSKKGADVGKMQLVSALTSTSGSQMYKVKKSDWEAYGSSVVIWCRAYGYLFGYANVQ